MLKKGDVVFTRGNGWLQRLIRWGETSPGESRTLVNHALLVVSDGPAPDVRIVEAEAKVQAGRFGALHAGDWFTAYRAKDMDAADADAICAAALAHVGESYGWGQLFLQLIDSKVLGGAYGARRLAHVDPKEICSRLVATAYAVRGFHFDLDDGAAEDPDSMLDYCVAHPELYAFVECGTL